MKRYIKTSESISNTIKIDMELQPIIYFDSNVAAAVYVDDKNGPHTDVNPNRIIDGPLSEYGQELENPVKQEFEEFKNDCIFIIKELGFTVIKQETSTDSKKI